MMTGSGHNLLCLKPAWYSPTLSPFFYINNVIFDEVYALNEF